MWCRVEQQTCAASLYWHCSEALTGMPVAPWMTKSMLFLFPPNNTTVVSELCIKTGNNLSLRPIVTSVFVWVGDGGIFHFVLQVASTNNSMKKEWKKLSFYNWTLLHQRSNFTVYRTVSWTHLQLDMLQRLCMVLMIQIIFGLLITTQGGFTSYILPVV